MRRLVCCLVVVLAPTALRAQECQGFASAPAWPANATVSTSGTENSRSYNARVSFANREAFGALSAGRTTYDSISGGSNTIAIKGGLSRHGRTRPIAYCATVGAGMGRGPSLPSHLGEPLETSSVNINIGLSVGAALITRSRFMLMPFVGIDLLRVTTKVGAFEGDGHTNVLNIGAGMLFGGWLVVRPSFGMPFGSQTTYPVWSLGAGVSFRPRGL